MICRSKVIDKESSFVRNSMTLYLGECCENVQRQPLLRLQSRRPFVELGCHCVHPRRCRITLIINLFFPLKFHMKATFSLENYCAYCEIITKIVSGLGEVIMALHFMAGCN